MDYVVVVRVSMNKMLQCLPWRSKYWRTWVWCLQSFHPKADKYGAQCVMNMYLVKPKAKWLHSSKLA